MNLDLEAEGVLDWLVLALQYRTQEKISRGLTQLREFDFDGFWVKLGRPERRETVVGA